MVRKEHPIVSHVDNDKDIQSWELPNEDTVRHKALIFIGNKTDLSGSKGNVIDLISIDMHWENKLNSISVVEGIA